MPRPPAPGPRVRPDRLLAHARRVADLLIGRLADEARKPEADIGALIGHAQALKPFLLAALGVKTREEIARQRRRDSGELFSRIRQASEAPHALAEAEEEEDTEEEEGLGHRTIGRKQNPLEVVRPTGEALALSRSDHPAAARDETDPLSQEERTLVEDLSGPNAKAKREDYRETAVARLRALLDAGAGPTHEEVVALRRRLALIERAERESYRSLGSGALPESTRC